MNRGVVVLFFTILLLVPFVSADIESSFSEVKDYMNQYDAGEITAPQLMVYVAYARNKMYEGEGDKGDLTESEVKKYFDEVERNDKFRNYWDAPYQKVFLGKDFNIVFKARGFVRNDREYYESRDDAEKSYYVDYELVPVISSDVSLEENLESFMENLEATADSGEDLDYEVLQEEFSAMRMLFEQRSRDDSDYCREFAESAGYEAQEEKDYYESEVKRLTKVFAIEMKEDCWTDTHCEQKCETREECSNEGQSCYPKLVCEEADCEDIFDEETNETHTVCEGEKECHEEQVCEDQEDNCWDYEECEDECEDEEICNEWEDGRLALSLECRDDGAGMWLESWGEKFERYQPINEGMNWNCEPEIQSLVTVRKVLQKDFNEDFVDWYFNEFIGEDYLKIMNGGEVIHDIVWKLINIDERVSEQLHCSETGKWPDGFEKIDIVYDDGNTHFEVWEKYIPMEGMDVEYYTTMYKYNWAPDKDMAKNLLNYMVDNEFVISAKDVAKIKADPGQMALIENLANKYGGSLDVKLKLSEAEGDFEISRYLEINPEDAVKIGSEEIKTDISIEVDFDILYDFIISMTKMEDGNRIEGPYWVQVHEREGPGNLLSVIGLVSKAWREGVTIKPKYALIKMFFSAKDIMAFMTSGDAMMEEESSVGESKISGEVVLDRE